MSIRRITVSVPDQVASRVKDAADGESVSAWVVDLIVDHLDSKALDRHWQSFYDDVAPTKSDVARADKLLANLMKPRAAAVARPYVAKAARRRSPRVA
jgi:hypothetical protein